MLCVSSDGNNTLDRDELRAGLASLGYRLPASMVDELFRRIDGGGSEDSAIDYEEFLAFAVQSTKDSSTARAQGNYAMTDQNFDQAKRADAQEYRRPRKKEKLKT